MRKMYSNKYSSRDFRHKCPSLWTSQDESSNSVNYPLNTSSAVMLRSCSSFLHRFSSRLKLQNVNDEQKQKLVTQEDYVMMS